MNSMYSESSMSWLKPHLTTMETLDLVLFSSLYLVLLIYKIAIIIIIKFIECMWGLNELTCGRCLEQCLTHSKPSVNINYYYLCLKPTGSPMNKYGIKSSEALAFRGSHVLGQGEYHGYNVRLKTRQPFSNFLGPVLTSRIQEKQNPPLK